MSKTLQFSVFTNLRLASMNYTPAHSKSNGENVSQRLQVNAYMNENRRGSSDDKSKAIALTAWGTGADILAWALSPGKEFTVFADLNVYDAPVYFNDQPVSMGGQPLMRKAYGYTIRRFDLGSDSWKHISTEIERQTRGVNFWVKGHQDAVNFKALLDARMATAKQGYNESVNGGVWGFCEDIRKPKYQHGAYNPATTSNTASMPSAQPVGVAPTAATVAAAFSGVPQAAPIAQPVAAPVAAPVATVGTPAQSFVMPQSQSGLTGV